MKLVSDTVSQNHGHGSENLEALIPSQTRSADLQLGACASLVCIAAMAAIRVKNERAVIGFIEHRLKKLTKGGVNT
jgi:hypothetical protein